MADKEQDKASAYDEIIASRVWARLSMNNSTRLPKASPLRRRLRIARFELL